MIRAIDRWHNGRRARKDKSGYVLLWEPTHPNKAFKGWQYEHRLVAELTAARYLTSDEHVHHINGVKDDNRPDNLMVLSSSEHKSIELLGVYERMRQDRAELEEYRRRFGLLEGWSA